MLSKQLGDVVKGIHFGASLEVRDPHTRQMERKAIKPFMVNQTTLILERGMLRIPHVDYDEMIRRQMLNYHVVRVSEKTGEPTYTSTDEHALDAMMLSILAFVEQHPEIANILEAISIARHLGFVKRKHRPSMGPTFDGGFGGESASSTEWDEPATSYPVEKVPVGTKRPRRRRRNGGGGFAERGTTSGSMPTRTRF